MTIEWKADRGMWTLLRGGSVIAASKRIEVLTRKFPTATVVYP